MKTRTASSDSGQQAYQPKQHETWICLDCQTKWEGIAPPHTCPSCGSRSTAQYEDAKPVADQTGTLTAEQVKWARQRAKHKDKPGDVPALAVIDVVRICDSHEALRADLMRVQQERDEAQRAAEIRQRMIDIPTAWELTLATPKDQHHEKCSYRVAGMLCDCAACRVMERVSGLLKAAEARVQALTAAREALRTEASALLAKLDVVEKATMGVYTLAHVHGMPYNGPDYSAEKQALRAALDAGTPTEARQEEPR